MAKRWLIAVLIAGLFGGKAFADCAPSPDTSASVIEYFQRFNKPLPEQFCAQDAGPQASVEPAQEARRLNVLLWQTSTPVTLGRGFFMGAANVAQFGTKRAGDSYPAYGRVFATRRMARR